MPQTLSREEFLALNELAKARRTALQNMFNGTKLVFGTADKIESKGKILKSAKKVGKNAKKLADIGKNSSESSSMIQSAAQDFIKNCAGVENIEEVIAAITSEAVSELVSEITPVVGAAYSAFKAGKAAKSIYKDGKALYKANDYKSGFRMGDPLAAADAVHEIIKRDLAKDSINFARHSAATGTKIAGFFADLGTGTTAGVGLVNSLAGLGLELTSLGMEIKEMRAGNKRLQSPSTLDLTVFSECPILGCYLLTCADTSSVANMFIADIGLPGWMDKVETLKKKKMDPLIKLAAKDIQKSRLQLSGLTGDKGTHMEKGFFAKNKKNAMMKIGLG